MIGLDSIRARILYRLDHMGDKRTRFAWLPVRIWEIHGAWIRRSGRVVWMKPVKEMMTLEGWTAYAHHQESGDAQTP